MQLQAAGTPFSIYLHVPYCTTRCGYCDFNTYTNQELEPGVSRSTWLETAKAELRFAREQIPDAPIVSTVFFGGGTPTLLPANDLVAAVAEIQELFGLAPDAEVTTEANPDTVDEQYLGELLAGNINRISFGMQSAVPKVLQVLDRTHTPGRAAEVVAAAHRVGFEHINLDLIYGSPGESLADLQTSLNAVLDTPVDHVSAYALTLENGTRMAAQVKRGELKLPDDEKLAEMYHLVDEQLHSFGFEWYEVSNWTRPGGECRHNLHYWQNHNWWGVGPGAHSHVNGNRWWNVKHPSAWTAMVVAGDLPAAETEQLDAEAIALEKLMLGIRLKTGLQAADYDAARVAQLVTDGLLDADALTAGQLRLTRSGRLLADTVIRTLGF